MRGRRRATRSCIRTKPYQRRSESSRSSGSGVGQVDEPVDGHRVVAGADDRPTVGHEAEQTGAEGLVVVHDVVIGPPDPPAPA